MKIGLIFPNSPDNLSQWEDYEVHEPLSLEYIAAPLLSDNDVRILDMRFDKNFDLFFNEFNPDILGITGFSTQVNIVKNIAERAKELKSTCKIVVGGIHATILPDDFNKSYIDIVVIGEGVFTFEKIVNAFKNNKNIEEIPGIAYKKENYFIKKEMEYYQNYDNYIFPARHLTAKYRKRYKYAYFSGCASMTTSKGCPNRCTFCILWKLSNGRFLPRSVDSMIKELKLIKEKFIFFVDDETMIDYRRMIKFAEKIKENKIRKRYYMFGRADTISKHPELLKIWKEIGLECVLIGFEAIDDDKLNKLNKGTKFEHSLNAIDILRKYKVNFQPNFIVNPDFNTDDFDNLLKFVKKYKLYNCIFPILTPLPCTDLYKELENKIITKNYELYDMIHLVVQSKLPKKEFYNNYFNLFKKSVPIFSRLSYILHFRKISELKGYIRFITKFWKIFKELKNEN